jgi:hypothetical protein
MKVPLRPSYAPPKLGFLPIPPPVRRLGAEFPALAPMVPESVMQGFVPKGVTDGILLAIGGAGITYFSRFFPGVGEPIGMVGGLGLMGMGVYRFYNVVTGGSEPTIESTTIPATQVPQDVYQLRGKILTPAQNGEAELSSMWTAIFSAQRTMKIAFSVTNTGQKAVTAQVEFYTQQFSRPLWGSPETAEFRTNYLLDKIGPGETKLVNAWQPIKMFQTLAPMDMTASLILRASAVDPGQVASTVSFTAGS